MRLRIDAISLYKKEVVYGRAGDAVKIISESGDVCIVEGENGNRFSVYKTDLAKEVKEKTEAAPAAAVPTNPIINRAPVAKKKKEAPLNQNKLF